MGKKKRVRNKTVFIALEGKREIIFLCFLQSLFDPNKNITLKFHPDLGGNSNKILDRVLGCPHEKAYAWFDEDDKLDGEHKKKLMECWEVQFPMNLKDFELQEKNIHNKKPIIIVSNPYSVEGILIKLFDKKLPRLITPCSTSEDYKANKKRMKSSIDGFFGNKPDIEYYKKNLTKEVIIAKAKEIKELKLLLTIFNIDIDKEQ